MTSYMAERLWAFFTIKIAMAMLSVPFRHGVAMPISKFLNTWIFVSRLLGLLDFWDFYGLFEECIGFAS